MPTITSMPSSSWLEKAVFDWLTQGSGLLLPTANHWVHAMTLGVICYFAAMMGFEAMVNAPMEHAKRFFIVWVPSLVLTNAMLTYYSSPMPWGGDSFHQLIPDIGLYLTKLINASTMATVSTAMENLLGRVVAPTNWWDFRGQILYLAAQGMVWLAEGIMFAFGTLSLLAMAVGITLGPLSIAMRIWPYMAHLFRSWVDYMVSWMSYGVVAAIVLKIWAMALIYGLPAIFHSTGIIEALILAKAFVLINCALFLCCSYIHSWAASLYGHAVSGAAGYPSQLRRLL